MLRFFNCGDYIIALPGNFPRFDGIYTQKADRTAKAASVRLLCPGQSAGASLPPNPPINLKIVKTPRQRAFSRLDSAIFPCHTSVCLRKISCRT